MHRGSVRVYGSVLLYSLAECLEGGGAYDVMGLGEEVGEINGAGGRLGRGNEGCVSYGMGGRVKGEIILLACKPVGLRV